MTPRVFPAVAAPAIGAALAIGLLVAGCGSAHAAFPSAPVAAIRPGASLAGNRALSRREAARLLAAAPVPAGAIRLSTVPRVVDGPAMGVGATGKVDRWHVWRIPLPYLRARAWLAAHRPRGLKLGITLGAGPGSFYGFVYTGPVSRAWGQAQLGTRVAPAGHGRSYLRADGQVAWLDPVPYPDTARGRRVHVTAAGPCPASDKGLAAVANPGRPWLRRHLLPGGTPVRGLECFYFGPDTGHESALARTVRLGPAPARAEAARMNRARVSHLVGSSMTSPSGLGLSEIVVLAYPGGGSTDLWLSADDIPWAANGYIVANRH